MYPDPCKSPTLMPVRHLCLTALAALLAVSCLGCTQSKDADDEPARKFMEERGKVVELVRAFYVGLAYPDDEALAASTPRASELRERRRAMYETPDPIFEEQATKLWPGPLEPDAESFVTVDGRVRLLVPRPYRNWIVGWEALDLERGAGGWRVVDWWVPEPAVFGPEQGAGRLPGRVFYPGDAAILRLTTIRRWSEQKLQEIRDPGRAEYLFGLEGGRPYYEPAGFVEMKPTNDPNELERARYSVRDGIDSFCDEIERADDGGPALAAFSVDADIPFYAAELILRELERNEDFALPLLIMTPGSMEPSGIEFAIVEPDERGGEREEGEWACALTLLAEPAGEGGRAYRIRTISNKGDVQIFYRDDIAAALGAPGVSALPAAIAAEYAQWRRKFPTAWVRLPLYVLVQPETPFEGFYDLWSACNTAEQELLADGPAPHLPRVLPYSEEADSALARLEGHFGIEAKTAALAGGEPVPAPPRPAVPGLTKSIWQDEGIRWFSVFGTKGESSREYGEMLARVRAAAEVKGQGEGPRGQRPSALPLRDSPVLPPVIRYLDPPSWREPSGEEWNLKRQP